MAQQTGAARRDRGKSKLQTNKLSNGNSKEQASSTQLKKPPTGTKLVARKNGEGSSSKLRCKRPSRTHPEGETRRHLDRPKRKTPLIRKGREAAGLLRKSGNKVLAIIKHGPVSCFKKTKRGEGAGEQAGGSKSDFLGRYAAKPS